MPRKIWSLFDAFSKPTVDVWEEWDELEPEERQAIEERYEANRNYKAASLLKKGIYCNDSD